MWQPFNDEAIIEESRNGHATSDTNLLAPLRQNLTGKGGGLETRSRRE